jgi:hypothetical protein
MSEAVAHLPAAVSLLLLEASFMQILGVSLTLTWPCRLCLLRVFLGMTATVTRFPLSNTLGEVALHPPSLSGLFIYSSHEKCPFPALQWNFPHTTTFTSFPAPGCCWACAATPAFSCRLVYLQFHEGLPLPTSSALRAPCPLCYVLFFVVVVIIRFVFFLFFPCVGVNLSRGLC